MLPPKVTKAKVWQGNDLTGDWLITRKLDGVRAIRSGEGYVSRAGKPLYNLEHLSFDDAEIFLGSWEASVSAVRTKNGTPVPKSAVYSLSPIDDSLIMECRTNPTADWIKEKLAIVKGLGDEGLVLRQGEVWLKVKDKETYDVPILGVVAGKGKHLGRMGALLTPMGKVGTGFSDTEREQVWEVGATIEVECFELTPDGRFRHPRFVRLREDK